jgi:HK97 family phage portal protein
MGLFSGLMKRVKNLSLTDEKAWDTSLWNLAGAISQSGEVVTESTALTYSAIWCAVNLIAGTVSTLPLQLLRKDQGKTITAKEQRIYRVLHDEFNPLMTAEMGRSVMAAHLLVWGNCYAEKVTNGVGDIVELWPIPPNRVRIESANNKQVIYSIQVDSQRYQLNRDRILHIAGLGFDGLQGYSVIAMARKSIGLAMAMETFGSRYFGEGTHPSGIITHPLAIKNNDLRKALKDQYAGLGKTHRLMLLEEGMDYKSIGVPPEDSQFLESRQFQIPEVARWFNLPPHKLKDLTRSSFSNIESEQISFVTDSILPWLIRLEQNYAMQLLSPVEKKREFFFRHNVDGLMRGNSKDRSEYYRTMFGIGAMSINDIREKENWDPVENGDERFVPLNMIPLSRLNEYLDRQKEQPKTPTDKEVAQ